MYTSTTTQCIVSNIHNWRHHVKILTLNCEIRVDGTDRQFCRKEKFEILNIKATIWNSENLQENSTFLLAVSCDMMRMLIKGRQRSILTIVVKDVLRMLWDMYISSFYRGHRSLNLVAVFVYCFCDFSTEFMLKTSIFSEKTGVTFNNLLYTLLFRS